MSTALAVIGVVAFFLSAHAAYGFGQTLERGYLEMAIVAGAIVIGCLAGLSLERKS